MAADGQHEISFSIPLRTLSCQPLFVGFIKRTDSLDADGLKVGLIPAFSFSCCIHHSCMGWLTNACGVVPENFQ